MSVLPVARLMFRSIIISLPIVSGAAVGATEVVPSPLTATDIRPTVEAPGTSTLPDTSDAKRPINIAFLMPGDDSPFLGAARIVCNGLLAANRTSDLPANVMMIEAPDTVPMDDQLDAAVFAGADVVVGPLQKNLVEMLALKSDLPLPVVTLNYAAVQNDQTSPDMVMLSLASDLEAEFIAREALKTLLEPEPGMLPPKVLILTTNKTRDLRLAEAYEKTLTEAGNDYERFIVTMENLQELQDKCRPHLSTEDQEAFNRMIATAEDDNARDAVRDAARARAAVSKPPYPVALLALGERDAGLVRNRLPLKTRVWATSATNPGDPKTSSGASALAYDLNNVVFAECPFILRWDAESFEARFKTMLPYSLTAKRLFALGMDAREIAENWARNTTSFVFQGETGKLNINREYNAQAIRTPSTYVIRHGAVLDVPVETLTLSGDLPETLVDLNTPANTIGTPTEPNL